MVHTDLYGYVLNDPINYIDPTGEWLGAIGIGITIVAVVGVTLLGAYLLKKRWEPVEESAEEVDPGSAFEDPEGFFERDNEYKQKASEACGDSALIIEGTKEITEPFNKVPPGTPR